ncbi:Fe-S cluster assembly protein SufD [Woodsholea maritima]|uniref:Fe-S cluster assembly protein SufD n=1 Tax=Woodsholea maritima TaxID=240237 RepID=UPI0003744C8B|nr:Fe-S cluster assembly protein SufD [Woodsholea maritima]
MTKLMTATPLEMALLKDLPRQDPVRQRLLDHGMPHRRVEEWKYSDLRRLSGPVESQGKISVKSARTLMSVPVAQKHSPSFMAALALSLGDEGLAFAVAAEAQETLSLELSATAGRAHKVLRFELGKGAKLTLHEIYRAHAGAFANILIQIVLGEGAELIRVIEQDDAPDALLVVTSDIELSPKARLHQTTLGAGAKLARLETHVTHQGEGAEADINGAYLIAAERHLDQTTFVRHCGPHGVTREIFKGAARAHGKGVFQGKILVEQGAQKTDAQMQHRAMLLDERAEIDVKPELEIYADDVACAHGNAMGHLDEDVLFYMRQRGLSEAEARTLLTESFLLDPLERIPDEALRTRLLGQLQTRLRGQS